MINLSAFIIYFYLFRLILSIVQIILFYFIQIHGQLPFTLYLKIILQISAKNTGKWSHKKSSKIMKIPVTNSSGINFFDKQ